MLTALNIIESLKPRCLVVGDLILDRYIHGSVTRINPEAPGVVFHATHAEARPGGAGAVATVLAGLGTTVRCFTAIGADHDLLPVIDSTPGIFYTWENRLPTIKERRVADGRLLYDRTDWGKPEPITQATEDAFIERLQAEAPWDAVLIADYGYGVCTDRLIRQLMPCVGGAPVLVDPARDADWSKYRGATLIKCNRQEADAGTKNRDSPFFSHLVVTFGRDGMAANGEGYPTTPRRVSDVTGAGDTVLAVLGACLAVGVDLPTACRLANVAAGLQVERLGVCRITPDELRAEIAQIATMEEVRA